METDRTVERELQTEKETLRGRGRETVSREMREAGVVGSQDQPGLLGRLCTLHPGVFILKWVLSSQQPAEFRGYVMFRGYAEVGWVDIQGQLTFSCGLWSPALYSTGWGHRPSSCSGQILPMTPHGTMT